VEYNSPLPIERDLRREALIKLAKQKSFKVIVKSEIYSINKPRGS
jgi:hypothetical protein